MRKGANLQVRERALSLRLDGLTYAAIGEELGLTRQRIQQLLEPPKEVREIILARSNSRCQNCGVFVAHGHIHHKSAKGIDSDKWNDLDNLVYLCLTCHRRSHHELQGRPLATGHAKNIKLAWSKKLDSQREEKSL